ncbi:progranulin-like [Labrus mixtus]|uniref:progranulin-like n=1 Tax=Labrus mixtus TaxID=508554 RepID=UPI0029BFF706|nr:progranulin-like [Labrus mixtus]
MTGSCSISFRKMLKVTLWLFVVGFASCSITCPDGNVCPDRATCCKTPRGFSCCPYPKAVCCSDLAHCCPSGFRCNLVTQMCEKEDQPWLNVPMVKKDAAEEPSAPLLPLSPLQELEKPDEQKSSVVYCDNYYYCPDGTTCCRHPKGAWFCCPYSPGRCCLDGYHCCPYGYDCDYTYTHCVRTGLRYPFTPKQGSVPAFLTSTKEVKSSPKETPMAALTEATVGVGEAEVIRCDSKFYCAQGMSCCKGPTDQWSCCPYKLGQCCADGRHCCQHGFTCDSTSLSCNAGFSQTPSREQEPAKTD